MAGHSKWANIKHRKARQDASRGKVWTKVMRKALGLEKLESYKKLYLRVMDLVA